MKNGSSQVTVQLKQITGGEEQVLESYTFPEGFSNPLDWFVTPYANIPAEGITGVLYQPFPQNACSTLQQIDFCNSQQLLLQNQTANLTRLALVDGYHTCIEQKLQNVKAGGFDAMITFSYNDSDLEVSTRVLDRTTGQFVNVISAEFPVVVVSEQFAETLQDIAIPRKPTDCFTTLVTIQGDATRQGWIGFAVALGMIVILVGVPFISCLCLCCCLCCVCVGGEHQCSRCCENAFCSCCWCRKSGVYEVNQIHVQVLGDEVVLRHPRLDELETSFSERGTAQSAQAERFQRVFENSIEPTARKYQSEKERNMSCAICLECFKEDETVHALSCDEHHVFHPYCIERWLESNSVCPVCRAFVVQPNF